MPSTVTPVAHHPHGYFSGSPKLEQLPDGRRKKLLETLVFTDPNGKKWVAPKGSIVDGASIPSIGWSIIGAPFTGKYLAASIIHDVACEEKKEKSKDVHKAFHRAMLASGVGWAKAKLMFGAVILGGPKWGNDKPPLTEKELTLERLEKFVEQYNLDTDILFLEEDGKKPTLVLRLNFSDGSGVAQTGGLSRDRKCMGETDPNQCMQKLKAQEDIKAAEW